MGKGRIVFQHGCYEYVLEKLYDTERLEKYISRIEDKISTLNEDLDKLKHNKSCVENALESITLEIKALIDAGSITKDAIKKYNEIADQLNKINQLIDDTEAIIATKQGKLGRLRSAMQRISSHPYILAHTADWNPEFSAGDVVHLIEPGRVERPGSPKTIAPGGGVWHGTDDSVAQPVESSTPAAWLYNHIMMPGAARWMARYRYATIKRIDESKDVCDLEIATEFWSGKILDYPKQSENLGRMYEVEIQYMSCNSKAFDVGDIVVVDFTKDTPVVNGFAKDPVPCNNLRDVTYEGSFSVDAYGTNPDNGCDTVGVIGVAYSEKIETVLFGAVCESDRLINFYEESSYKGYTGLGSNNFGYVSGGNVFLEGYGVLGGTDDKDFWGVCQNFFPVASGSRSKTMPIMPKQGRVWYREYKGGAVIYTDYFYKIKVGNDRSIDTGFTLSALMWDQSTC